LNELTYRSAIVEPATLDLLSLSATFVDVYGPLERCFGGGPDHDAISDRSRWEHLKQLIAEAEEVGENR
jgi:hypothetical protein